MLHPERQGGDRAQAGRWLPSPQGLIRQPRCLTAAEIKNETALPDQSRVDCVVPPRHRSRDTYFLGGTMEKSVAWNKKGQSPRV